ncbi:MAG: cytochrome c3 family protein [Coriobacteriales bacterium]
MVFSVTVGLSGGKIGVACATTVPHGGFDASAAICYDCHKPHVAASDRYLFRVLPADGDSGEIALCYSCHDGSGASTNVKTGGANSFVLTSGHRVENLPEAAIDLDLTNRCSSCHSPHSSYATNRRLPKRSIVTSSGSYAVTGADTSWCLACHNDSNDWYVSTTSTPYPSTSNPTKDSTGYPVWGTFPGRTVYLDPAKNGHMRIPAGLPPDPMAPSQTATRVAGDCLWCHSAHRGANAYDGLPATFTVPVASSVVTDRTRGDYAAACFACHGGGSWEESGAVDIQRYAVKSPDDTSATNGHRIKTTGAALPVNAPLPCFECHNPHGSARGNKMLLADTLGKDLEATTSAGVAITAAADVRKFCFTCHSTSDATPKVWDSVAGVYADCTAGMMFEGLRRDGTLLTGQTKPSGYGLDQNYLRLKALGGAEDKHAQASTKSCYDCHGKSYAGAGSPNVHAPTLGVSNGATACYGCHSEYLAMEDNLLSATGGASRLNSYHHVLGSTALDGDHAPATQSSYPTSTSDVFCVSCHGDHDTFNSDKGANLRMTISASSVSATNTDFINPGTTGAPGICVSCHSSSLTKQNGDQRSSGTTYTVSVDATGFAASAHQYKVTATFTASPFRGDCVKCHNDEMTKSYQSSSSLMATMTTFGVHSSPESRILARLGGTLNDPYEEAFCFKCHSKASDSQGSTWTFSYARDRYGVASMSATSVAIYGQVVLGSGAFFAHDPRDYSNKHKASHSDETTGYIGQVAAANKHVECADCHDPHDAGAGARTIGGANGNKVGPAQYGVQALSVTLPSTAWSTPTASAYSWVETATYEYQTCLKCHTRGANAALESWGGAGADAWTDVALEFNPKNTSYHPVMGVTSNDSSVYTAWMKDPWKSVATQTMACSDCHGDVSAAALGPHGSSIKHILKGYWPLDSSGTPYTLSAVSEDTRGLLCAQCHVVDTSTGPRAHLNTNHRSEYCYRCHIIVPHGGMLQGLIGDADSTMPSRYAYNNVKGNLWVAAYKGDGDSSRTDCFVTGSSGCDSHSTTSTTGNW